QFTNASMYSYGYTDSGRQLSLFVIASDDEMRPASIKAKNKVVLLINNGIHPGEPDGIDASMKLAEDLLTKPEYKKLLEHVVVCIIPVFNIDGSLFRGCCSRLNQDGPEEYGFRGNYQNLDLNRDFIKCDAQNTQSFQILFREWDPDVFIDTHVSDGADYPYAMTLIATQHDKLEKGAGKYLQEKMLPAIYHSMDEKKVQMCPYVNSIDETPDDGLVEFLETPRFASGYTALFNTFSFITESHMLKPFPQRVEATYAIEKSILEFSNAHSEEIRDARYYAKRSCAEKKVFPLQWTLDTINYEMISFKGYTAKHKQSNVTGQQRLYYDKSSPYEKKIRYYNHYVESVTVEKPFSYIVPQCWRKVIDQLRINKINMQRLAKDTTLNCEVYYIDDYNTGEHAYEGHHLHSNVKVRAEMQQIHFLKGDYVIDVDLPENRFIVETLEPQGVDSYFAWGFFDPILQQKEYFSSYVFEEKAEEILKNDPALKSALEEKKKADTKFAADGDAQLNYIYEHSPYFEKSYKRYPVVRLKDRMNLLKQ
ncbi:MAG: M14 family zinc carboxypeptidase, partial [Bacteroidota bacterium]